MSRGSGRGNVTIDNPSMVVLNNLIPVEFDSIECSYTGVDLTNVVYKSIGVTVATLTMTYSSNILQSVQRT